MPQTRSLMHYWLFFTNPWAKREKSSLDNTSSHFHLWMLQRADMMKSCMIARPDSLTYPLCALLNIRPFARPELALESFPKPETEFTLALFNDSEQYEFREPFKYLTVTHRLVRNERRATKKGSYCLCLVHGGFVWNKWHSISGWCVFGEVLQYQGNRKSETLFPTRWHRSYGSGLEIQYSIKSFVHGIVMADLVQLRKKESKCAKLNIIQFFYKHFVHFFLYNCRFTFFIWKKSCNILKTSLQGTFLSN